MNERKRILLARLAAYSNIQFQIENLQAQLDSIETAAQLHALPLDRERVSGGSSFIRSIEINLISRDALKLKINILEREYDLIRRNIEALTPTEQRIIDILCIQRRKNAADYLSDEIGYSIPQIYRIRNNALKTLCIRLYGTT